MIKICQSSKKKKEHPSEQGTDRRTINHESREASVVASLETQPWVGVQNKITQQMMPWEQVYSSDSTLNLFETLNWFVTGLMMIGISTPA